MNLKKLESYLRVNLMEPGPRLIKKGYTGPRSHKGRETLEYTIHVKISNIQEVSPCRSRCKLEDNIRKNSREVGCENAGWIELTGNSVHFRSLWVPQNAATSRSAKELPAFFKTALFHEDDCITRWFKYDRD